MPLVNHTTPAPLLADVPFGCLDSQQPNKSRQLFIVESINAIYNHQYRIPHFTIFIGDYMIIDINNRSVAPIIFGLLSHISGFKRDSSGKYFDRAGELVVLALDTANQTDSPVSPSERRAIELLLNSANSTGQRNLDLTQRHLANVGLENSGSQIDPPIDLVPYDPRSGTPSRLATGPELPAPTPEACRTADARGYRPASPNSIEGGP